MTTVPLTAAALLAGSLTVPHDSLRPVAASYPTNAGKIFRWGDSQWHDGFVEPVTKAWAVNRPRQVRNQHGMLTLEGYAAAHNVTATLTGHGRRYGRWEARVRSNQYRSDHTPYRVVWELVPVGDYHCGARSIVLSSYRMGDHRAHLAIRNLHNAQFSASRRRNLGNGVFHTYAVEVTRTHVSWFVDTQVIRTERRSAALSGARFKVRFRLVAALGRRMNPGRMQMDWVRYYTLARPNARSIKAPATVRGTFGAAC